jgi:iron(III) transport system permease protein
MSEIRKMRHHRSILDRLVGKTGNQRIDTHRSPRMAVAVLWFIVLVAVAWPMAMLLFTGVRQFFTATLIFHSLFGMDDGQAFWNSIWSSFVASLFALVIGCATAWILDGLPKAIFRWGYAMAILPLLIPPFIGAFSWVQAYGTAGLTDMTVHWSWRGLFGWSGVVVLLGIHSAPLAYFASSGALSRVPGNLMHSSRIHGANCWTTFRLVVWPLLKPALLSSAILIFAFNLGDFGIPFELGIPGHFQTAATQVYADLTDETVNGFPSAVALSMLMVVTVMIVMIGSQRLHRNQVRSDVLRSHTRTVTATGKVSSLKKVAILGFYLFTFFSVFLPFLSTVLVALTKAYGLAPVPKNWDIQGILHVYTGDTGLAGIHSIFLSVCAAVAVTILGLVVAEITLHSRSGRWINLLASVPYALPGTVVGVAVILGFNRWFYGTSFIILLAYVTRFWGLSDTIVRVRGQVPANPLRAVRIFGASGWSAYRFGILPFLGPVVESVMILVFISAVYELTMSSLLYTPSSETLAVVVLNAEQAGDVRTMAVISVTMTLLIFGAVTWLNGLRGKGNDREGVTDYAEEMASGWKGANYRATHE